MKANRGFSLIELLVATFLFGIAMAAMAALNEVAFRDQRKSLAKNTLDNNATLLGRSVQQAFASASYVQTPSSGTASLTSLMVWRNLNPADFSPLDPSRPRLFQYHCIKSVSAGPPASRVQDDVYLYASSFDQWPAPAITCGASPPAGVTRTLVAGGIRGMTVSALFTRADNNAVLVYYALSLAQQGGPAPDCPNQVLCVTQTTQMTLDGALE